MADICVREFVSCTAVFYIVALQIIVDIKM